VLLLQVVIANAWHHRSDVFVSLAVCAGLVGGMFDYPLLDPLVGVLVSGILVHQGIVTMTDSVKDLGDRPASPEETEALRATCLEVDGIQSVEYLQARMSGPFLYVDCTVGVPGTITASAAHRLSELAKEALLREHRGRVVGVIVHADPIGQTGLGELLPDWARHHGKIRSLVEETLRAECTPEIQSLSDVQVYYKDDGSVGVHLEVVMPPHMTITQANMVARHAKLVLQEHFPGMTYIDIDLELDFHPTNHHKFRDSSYRYKAT
jgi:divalent metal cation (Fe/Co/Zn/Cd) transporter